MVTQLKPLIDNKRGIMDRRIFVDRDIYDQELEQIFGRCWLFLGHESQISHNNDFTSTYMGEDPILLTRDNKGKLHAFLNMCRHRGNRICRADYGNAPSFMCTYHGWTFATDGKLVGVPGYKEAYFEELDRSQWGLVEAGHIDSYKGLVFATWDMQAPSLIDYLGDIAWYLDLHVDRREGGTELAVGISRWMMNSNWKFPADNFGGDGYHASITHASTNMAGIRPEVTTRRGPSDAGNRSYSVHAGNGHGVVGFGGGGGDGSGGTVQRLSGLPEKIGNYYREHAIELKERLGDLRGKNMGRPITTVFPNFSTHSRAQLRSYHPKGPEKTEMWVYCLMDKEAPAEVKSMMRSHLTLTFGPSGGLEQDDMDNWIQCTTSGRGWAGRHYPINVQLGLGHETTHETIPGSVAPSPSEANQRAFYGRWAEIMDAPNWSSISITPRSAQNKR